VPNDWPLTVNAVSGYSGGGKPMIAEFEEHQTADNFRIYAMGQTHKHAPEMKKHAGLNHAPMFLPAVGRFAQGMIIEVPLPLWALPKKPKRAALHTQLKATYASERFVKVVPLAEGDALKLLGAEGCNDTNRLELYVFGTDEQARLVARLDNLGKGASGAAVQSLNIALGLDEASGLDG